MRLPYVPNPPQTTTPEDAEIVSRVQARRAPGPLQSIDLTLLHAPAVASGWNAFFGSGRDQSTLPADIREVSILRVAVLCKSKFELNEHTPYAMRAGVSDTGIKAVMEGTREGLTDAQWAAVQYAEHMTRDVKVPREVFDGLRAFVNDRQMVEVTATVGALNCATRFLAALDVGEYNED